MSNTLTPKSVPNESETQANAQVSASQQPSVHVRALITWLAIFPLVAIAMMATAPLVEGWHPILRSLVLTVIVVPAAVYLVVPRLFAGYGALMRRRNAKR